MYSIPELKIIVALVYSKSLTKTGQYSLACELIQNEFYNKPIHTVYLYYYGKYGALSPHPKFHWASIGILKECLNSCVSQRAVKINYYLGIAYSKTTQTLKSLKYFEKSKEGLKKNTGITKCFCLSAAHLNEIEKLTNQANKIKNFEFVIKKKSKEVEYCFKKEKKRPELPVKEIQNLNSMIKTIYKEDPYNACLLKIMVYWDILRDKNSTIQAFEEGIKMTPNNINIYIEFWKFMKYLKKTDKMLEISEQLMKVIDNSSVPTDQWIEAHDLRFKTLLMKGSTKDLIEEAINTLKKICYILPPLPVDGLWYIKDAHEEAENQKEAVNEKPIPYIKEEFKHLFLAPPDQSGSPAHRKAESSSKIPSITVGFYLSLKDGKSHLPLSKESVINTTRTK